MMRMQIPKKVVMNFVYVIMPVNSDPHAALKRDLLSQIAARFQLQLCLPRYEKEGAAFNLGKTLARMRRAAFVFADLSLARPSCYYELGLAEALGKTVHAIAQIGTDIHQTSVRKTVKYYADYDELQSLVAEIFVRAQEN